MNLDTTVEAVLREAGYETWETDQGGSVVCFESPSVLGFCHFPETTVDLLATWRDRETMALQVHASRLRAAGQKAWNVYSVFLTADKADEDQQRGIGLIEEDLSRTRKIARAGMVATKPVRNALSPLLPLVLTAGNLNDLSLEDRLRRKLSDLPGDALEAFLDQQNAEKLVNMLRASS